MNLRELLKPVAIGPRVTLCAPTCDMQRRTCRRDCHKSSLMVSLEAARAITRKTKTIRRVATFIKNAIRPIACGVNFANSHQDYIGLQDVASGNVCICVYICVYMYASAEFRITKCPHLHVGFSIDCRSNMRARARA